MPRRVSRTLYRKRFGSGGRFEEPKANKSVVTGDTRERNSGGRQKPFNRLSDTDAAVAERRDPAVEPAGIGRADHDALVKVLDERGGDGRQSKVEIGEVGSRGQGHAGAVRACAKAPEAG